MIKVNFKKGIALLLIVTLMFSIAACGGSKSPAPQEPAVKQESAAGEQTTDQGPAVEGTETDEGEAVLEMWMLPWDDWQQEWITTYVEKYNEQKEGVTINLSFVPESTWGEKIITAQAANVAPDIYPVNLANYATEVARGTIQAMDPYVDLSIFDDLFPNIKNAIYINGNHYGYPYQIEAGQVLFYRKDMFEQAGLDPNKPPKSWAELYEYAEKLTTQYTYGFQINTNDGDMSWTSYGLQYNTTGGFAINDNWDAAIVDTNDWRDLFGYYKTLYDMRVVPEQALIHPFHTNPLCEGSLAMISTGSWNFQLIRDEYPDVADLIGVAPVPTRDGDPTKGTSAVGGWGFAVDANSSYPKAAAEFISWLLAGDPDIMIDFCTRAGFGKSSPRFSVSDAIKGNPALKQDEWLQVLSNEIMPYTMPEPAHDWAITHAVGFAILRVLTGEQSIDDAISQCGQEINDYIALNNLAGTNPKNQ